MKELSIEDKAKHYDEAVAMAMPEECNIYVPGEAANRHMLNMFPELKESDDDRIRESIIDFLFTISSLKDGKTLSNEDFDSKVILEWVAWLKKQGGHAKFIKGIQVGDKVTRNEDGVLVNLSQLNRVAKKEEKQGEKTSDKIVEKARTEKQRVLLTETDGSANIVWDTRSLQDVKMLLEYGLKYINCELEKQGEQKPYGQMEKCIKCQFNMTGYCNGTCILKNKIEPKFHEGDWVVTDKGDTVQIGTVNNDYYTIGNGMLFSMPYVDTCWHLWTIADAKDGDVLCLDYVIAIFKKYIGQEECICYCSICEDGDLEIPIENGEDNVYGCTNTTPASKEQRDLLFVKMKEACYEWDENKKELIKL